MNDENQTGQNPAGQTNAATNANQGLQSDPQNQANLDAELKRIKEIADNEAQNVNDPEPVQVPPDPPPPPKAEEGADQQPPQPEPETQPNPVSENTPPAPEPDQGQEGAYRQNPEQPSQQPPGVPLPNLAPEGENKSSKTLIIIATVLFVLSIVGIGLYYLGMKKASQKAAEEPIPLPTEIATPAATVDPIAGWLTYEDADMSFKYPSGWKLTDKIIESGDSKISITVVDKDSSLINECMNLTKTETLDGLVVKRFTRVTTGELCATSDTTPREIWVVPNETALTPGISYKYSATDQTEAEDVFDNLITTFKFLEETATSSASPSPSASASSSASPLATP